MALLKADSEPVYVIETRTGEVEEARIDDRGIVREIDGAGAYSDGSYQLLVEPAP